MSKSATRDAARRAALPYLFAAIAVLVPFFARATERGLPLITIHPAEVHRAGPQTFDIAQDAQGILYFGNLQGLLKYDGAWWRLRTLPDDQVALSVAADDDGRVAIGLVDDFGYLVQDETGAEEYRSLLGSLPPDKRDIRDVTAICTVPGGFLYVTETSLLHWDGGTGVRILAEH